MSINTSKNSKIIIGSNIKQSHHKPARAADSHREGGENTFYNHEMLVHVEKATV
jgi:hypothetical protein